jgi:hypothetical protein
MTKLPKCNATWTPDDDFPRTYRCEGEHFDDRHRGQGTLWRDSDPGAKPHAEPTPTEAEARLRDVLAALPHGEIKLSPDFAKRVGKIAADITRAHAEQPVEPDEREPEIHELGPTVPCSFPACGCPLPCGQTRAEPTPHTPVIKPVSEYLDTNPPESAPPPVRFNGGDGLRSPSPEAVREAERITCDWFHCPPLSDTHKCGEHGPPLTERIARAMDAFAEQAVTSYRQSFNSSDEKAIARDWLEYVFKNRGKIGMGVMEQDMAMRIREFSAQRAQCDRSGCDSDAEICFMCASQKVKRALETERKAWAEKLADAVATAIAKERDECAKIFDRLAELFSGRTKASAQKAAKLIRARGAK